MNRREKTLTAVSGGLLACLIAYLILHKLLLGPSAALNVDIANLSDGIGKLKLREIRKKAADRKLREVAGTSFGTQEAEILENVRAWLTRLLAASGLDKGPMNKVSGGRLTGSRTDVMLGWSVKAEGSLDRVVRFLHLLRADPHLHRVAGLTVTPQLTKGMAQVRLTYQTLLMGNVMGSPPASTRPAEQAPVPALSENDKGMYASITYRDIFRPYIRRRPEPRPVPQQEPPRPPTPPRPAPPPAAGTGLQIVSLTRWDKVQDITIRNLQNGDVRTLKIGDKLLGGVIVMVDERSLPSPKDPKLMMDSRAILKIGNAYWAVDRGQMLTEKRRLRRDELPPELRQKTTTTAPTKLAGAAK